MKNTNFHQPHQICDLDLSS